MRILTIALLSASLALTACGKKAEETKADTKPAEQATETAPTTNVSSYSKVLAVTSGYAMLLAEVQKQNLTNDQKSCLYQADAEALAPQIEELVKKHIDANALKEINDAFAKNGLDERAIKSMKDAVLFAMGDTKKQAQPLSAEDQKQIMELSKLPAVAKLESSFTEAELNTIGENFLKAEFQRCNIGMDKAPAEQPAKP